MRAVGMDAIITSPELEVYTRNIPPMAMWMYDKNPMRVMMHAWQEIDETPHRRRIFFRSSLTVCTSMYARHIHDPTSTNLAANQ